MIYCSKCGTQNNKENNFCKKCGEKIKKISSENKEKKNLKNKKEELSDIEEKKVVEVKDDINIKKQIEELKEEVSKDVQSKVEDVKEEVSNDIKEDVIEDIKEEIKKEVRKEVRTELSETIEIAGLTRKKEKKSSSPLLILLMFLVLVGGYFYLSYINGPRYLTKEYIESLIEKDYDKIYNSVGISGDTTFINKNDYIELLKENGTITDYEIEDVIYSSDKKKAIVSVSIIYETSSGKNKKNMDVEFYRGDEKVYIIVDTWNMAKQNRTGVNIIEDYKIYVPKDSEITFDNIKVENKYLEENNDNTKDVYILPQVFEKETKLKIILPNGMELIKNVSPSEYYNEYKLNIDISDIKNDELSKIEKEIKNSLNNIMTSVIQKKEFVDIKDYFSKETEINNLEKIYNEYLDKQKKKNYNIVNFNIEGITLSKVQFNYLYQFVIDVQIDYEATISENNQNKTFSDFGYYTFKLNYEDGIYKLVDINQLPNIFYNH